MPPRKYTPNPYGEPKRSFSSRNSCSSLTISFGSRSLNRSHVCSRRLTESTAASRGSWRRDSMSRYISRTFSDHCTIASRSSLRIFPSVRRQRAFVSSRVSCSPSQGSIPCASRPLPKAHELADLLRVLGRDLADEVDEHAAREATCLFQARERLLLGPVGEAARPEVVVLVEALVLALGEVVATPLEAVLQRGERLVAVDVDALGLALDLVLEVREVLGARLVVDRGDDRRGEVEDLLELARRDVEQVADARRDALEEPDVRDGRGEVDVAHALATHLLPRHFDAAALADDPLVADALVLAAVALPVLRRTEDALAKQTVTLGLERAVVDGLRLRHLAGRPVADHLAGCNSDPNCVKVVDVDQVALLPFASAQDGIPTRADSAA